MNGGEDDLLPCKSLFEITLLNKSLYEDFVVTGLKVLLDVGKNMQTAHRKTLGAPKN